MDENKEFGFDWKETPIRKHPKHCRCPKHEYINELAASAVNSKTFRTTIKLCPDHYTVYLESKKEYSLFERIATKMALKLGIVDIKQIPYMMSEECYYCRFGTGGRKNKPLTPLP